MIMTNFVWVDSLSVGNLVVDSGHQNLIGMINSIDYAMHNADHADLLRVLKRFHDFARLHFKDEEQIMQSVKFPCVTHRLEHQYLLEDLQNTINRLSLNQSHESALEHYPDFLQNWLLKHIEIGTAMLKPTLSAHPYDFMPA